jgi:hypothetical protein
MLQRRWQLDLFARVNVGDWKIGRPGPMPHPRGMKKAPSLLEAFSLTATAQVVFRY